MFDDDPQRAEDARRLYLGAVRHAEALHVVGRVASEFYGAEATEVRDVDDKPEITIQNDKVTPQEAAAQVLTYLEEKGLLPAMAR